MKKRIITAAVLVPILLLVLYTAPKIVMVLCLSFICAVAAVELLYNTGLVRHVRMVAYAAVTAACVPLWCYFSWDVLWAQAGILLLFLLLFLEMMLDPANVTFDKAAICLVGGLVIPYLLSGLVRIFAPDNGRFVILIPFVVAFLADSGAYFIGCRFGRHKLAPTISPKKSVEGVLGGMTTASLGMLLYVFIMQYGFQCQVNYGYALVYGIVGSLLDTFGDLCLSVVKRQTDIKDYGDLIPGHGGVLDRFDSLIVVAPLVEMMLIVFPVVVK